MANRCLTLPEWTEKPNSFAAACTALANYCSSIKLPETNSASFISRLFFSCDYTQYPTALKYEYPFLIFRVNSILEKCQAHFEANLSKGVPQVENIPWTEIFLVRLIELFFQ